MGEKYFLPLVEKPIGLFYSNYVAGCHRGVFTLRYQQKKQYYYGDPTAQPNGIRRNAQVGRQ